MVAGTDPRDAADHFQLNIALISDSKVSLTWMALAGKAYGIQKWDSASDSWMEVASVPPSVISQIQSIDFPEEETGIFRATVKDVDADGDGLNAWEEGLLGWSDQSSSSSGAPEMGDYEAALRLLEGAAGVTLVTGVTLPQRLPTAAEAARFLVQSSFGPTSETVAEVMASGLGSYLDAQLALPVSTTGSSMSQTGMTYSASWWRHGWWRTVLIAPDQLRQRMAYALSQVFVVNNEEGSVIGDNVFTQASYYDAFLTGAFGSYRDLVGKVTYSPSMGFYLSHLNNRKSDPATNRFPDENFAREIMQLFTIGLWKLNLDGTRIVDADGNDIPTYDNAVITEMAKIFTGMSNGTTMRGQPATSFFDPATGEDYKAPMIVFDEEHESGEKVLFDGLVIPAGLTGDQDVQQTLDLLCSHDNVAPFISRLLIQRFTCSNPSPAYLGRVSAAWTASNGNLGRVMRAILLDSEVRSPDHGEGKRGKIREPLIRMVHIMRAFAKPDQSGKYGVLFDSVKTSLGQFVMSSPSVFNFYLPDYVPPGVLTERGWFSPELQIATTSALLSAHDLLKETTTGHWIRGTDLTDELDLLSDPEALLDRLDLLLTYGEMSPITRAAAKGRILGEPATVDKVVVAIQTIVTSPDFSVLK